MPRVYCCMLQTIVWGTGFSDSRSSTIISSRVWMHNPLRPQHWDGWETGCPLAPPQPLKCQIVNAFGQHPLQVEKAPWSIKILPHPAPTTGNNEGGQWRGEQWQWWQPVWADPIIVAVAMAGATCPGGHYSCLGIDGGGWRWWAAAVAVGGGQQCWQRWTASGRPPPPLSLAAARQSLEDNGQWPEAEGCWEAELFTNKIVGTLR